MVIDGIYPPLWTSADNSRFLSPPIPSPKPNPAPIITNRINKTRMRTNAPP